VTWTTRAQVILTDTSAELKYTRIKYTPRLSASFQKSPLVEFGICRQWSYHFERFTKTDGWYSKNSSGYFGTYLSGEALLTNDKTIYGIKFGVETVLIGGSSTGIVLGIEATDYIYNTRHYLGLTPKFVIPVTRNATPLAFISYGYCINDFSSLSTLIGNHRFSFIINLCPREHRKINNMYKHVRDKVKDIETKR
jgi:hypothetical protein